MHILTREDTFKSHLNSLRQILTDLSYTLEGQGRIGACLNKIEHTMQQEQEIKQQKNII